MVRRIRLFTFILFIALLNANSGFALDDSDKRRIEFQIENYVRSWNETAGVGFSEVFEENSDFVNIFGARFSGKEEIEKRHIEILQSFLKDSKLEIVSKSFREVTPEVVIAWVQWKLNGFRTPQSDLSKPGDVRRGIFTQVFHRTGDRWLITTSHNTMALQ